MVSMSVFEEIETTIRQYNMSYKDAKLFVKLLNDGLKSKSYRIWKRKTVRTNKLLKKYKLPLLKDIK